MEERRGGEHSPALQEAQRQLESLRARHLAGGKFSKKAAGEKLLPKRPLPHSRSFPPLSPDHLGWGSGPLTKALSIAQAHAQKESGPVPQIERPDVAASSPPPTRPLAHAQPSRGERCVKVYPDIALGMLRNEQVAAGRIWLLLKYLDDSGRGWVSVVDAREGLAGKGADLRVCGWRQLRKLLARGDGLFWHRSAGRIWLRSVAKVAAGLRVMRLTGSPVAVPLAALCQGIGVARAHLFSTFHSSRAPNSGAGGDKLIARASLRELSHVSRQTQAHYERRANVRSSANFAVGGKFNAVNHQNSAWRHGRAAFRFRDEAGRLGQKGNEYVAWQLPNNYVGPHERRPKGQQKRINRELVDLFMKGMTGNDKHSKSSKKTAFAYGRYFDRASTAAASYNVCPSRDHYWRSQLGEPNRYRIWHCLAGLD